jgi:outer membrane protein assembly factor BamE (lipoprotein component of BamABCDE complex)
MSSLRKRFSVLLTLGLTACSTVQIGSAFDLRAFESQVQRGVTTQGQVRGWLGAPTGTGVHVDTNGERYEEWTYYHGTGRLPNMRDAEIKILQVRFDRNGVVRGYNWSGGP